MAADERTRILLALDACSNLSAALAESVAAMAARLDAELEGLFVEDAALLSAAALPFVSEVSAAGHERSFTLQNLRELNASVSENLERLLARVADEQRVRWKYHRAEGDPIAMAYAASMQCDLFVPGRDTRHRSQAGPQHGRFHRVGMVVSQSPHTERALSVVRALARNGHTREVLLVSERHPPAELMSALSGAGLRTYVQTAPLAEAVRLLGTIGHHEPGLLIAPRALFTPSTLPRKHLPLLLLR